MKVQPINRHKMYSAMVKLCIITIISCCILRIFGYHGFDLSITNVPLHHIIRKIINGILYLINSFSFILLLTKCKLKWYKYIPVALVYSTIFILSLSKQLLPITVLLELISYIVFALIYIKDKWYKKIIEAVTIFGIFTLVEFILGVTKSLNVHQFQYNFTEGVILMIDYYIIKFLLILKFYKGGHVYVSILIWGRLGWKTFLDILSKRKRNQKSLQQNKENIQEVGYKFFVVFLSIAQFAIVGTACYFVNHVFLQYIIVAVSFFVMKAVFGHSYHAETIIKCTTLACIIFISATRLSLPLPISVLFNIILGTVVAYIMYIFYYFFKFTDKNGKTIYRGMSKEELDAMCKDIDLEEIEYNVLYQYYCCKKKRYLIGNDLGYSEDNISKIKKKALDKLV